MSAKGLRIAERLTLPAGAVTHAMAVLGQRGSGKSNTAVVLAEEMWRIGGPWVAVDPKGDWWGLRSSRDGKGPGLALPVLGGLHGDIALESPAGASVADAIVDESLTCVLDVSDFSKAERARFLVDFFDRLYRRHRKSPEPRHVFLEEAHEYIPQQSMRETARLKDSASRVVLMGRTFGLGSTAATQRSARLHKDVLTQSDTLIVHRTGAKQDRDAIEGWVAEHGVERELLASLRELEDGEAWIWSPHKLKVVERVRVRRRETFDSGATPELGKAARRSPTLAEIDVPGLASRFADAIEKARQEDPAELRRQLMDAKAQNAAMLGKVVVLEKRHADELAAAQGQPVEVRVEVAPPGLVEDLHDVALGFADILRKLDAVDGARADAVEYGKAAEKIADRIAGLVVGLPTASPPARGALRHRIDPASAASPQAAKAGAPARAHMFDEPRQGSVHSSPPRSPDGFTPTAPQRRILDALAWFEALGLPTPERVALAFMAGASATSSSFTNNLGALRTASLIDYPATRRVALTTAGRPLADPGTVPQTTEALQAAILDRLPRPQTRIVAALIRVYPKALARDELAERASASASSSSYTNNLGALRTLGLIDYPERGTVAALPVLFIEGRP